MNAMPTQFDQFDQSPDSGLMLPKDKAVIFLAGPQGCGKGTAGKRLAKNHELGYSEMSTELKAMANHIVTIPHEGEMLTLTVAEAQKRGLIIPFAKIQEIHQTFLSMQGGKIGDGYNREPTQAEDMINALSEEGSLEHARVVLFDISEERTRQQLAVRAVIEGRADDQSQKVVDRRLRTFYDVTMPAVERFEKIGKVVRIKADTDIDPADTDPAMVQLSKDIVYGRMEAALGWNNA